MVAAKAQEAPEATKAGDDAPPAKQRLAPKLGLNAMVVFMMDLRHRGRMRLGHDAGEVWVRLSPVDLEKMEDIAETLEFFRLQRVEDRARAKSRPQFEGRR